MTIRQYFNEMENFEYSNEYYEMFKLETEISVMNKYLECLEFSKNNAGNFNEGFLLEGFDNEDIDKYMEGVFSKIASGEAKLGGKIINLFMRAVTAFIKILKSIIPKLDKYTRVQKAVEAFLLDNKISDDAKIDFFKRAYEKFSSIEGASDHAQFFKNFKIVNSINDNPVYKAGKSYIDNAKHSMGYGFGTSTNRLKVEDFLPTYLSFFYTSFGKSSEEYLTYTQINRTNNKFISIANIDKIKRALKNNDLDQLKRYLDDALVIPTSKEEVAYELERLNMLVTQVKDCFGALDNMMKNDLDFNIKRDEMLDAFERNGLMKIKEVVPLNSDLSPKKDNAQTNGKIMAILTDAIDQNSLILMQYLTTKNEICNNALSFINNHKNDKKSTSTSSSSDDSSATTESAFVNEELDDFDEKLDNFLATYGGI